LCECLDLDRVLQQGIGTVPLSEILAAHESAMLDGPAIVMPKIEILEINRLRERLTGDNPIFAQTEINVLDFLDFLVGARNHFFCLAVDRIDDRTCVTL